MTRDVPSVMHTQTYSTPLLEQHFRLTFEIFMNEKCVSVTNVKLKEDLMLCCLVTQRTLNRMKSLALSYHLQRFLHIRM